MKPLLCRQTKKKYSLIPCKTSLILNGEKAKKKKINCLLNKLLPYIYNSNEKYLYKLRKRERI